MKQIVRNSWIPKRLNELGFVGRGRSRNRPRNDPTLYAGPYPFIQTADIMVSELRITKYSQTYNEKGLAQSKLWDQNTLCMTIAGENTAETAILSFKACFPDSIVGFITDSNKADVRFVKYSLDTMKQQLKSVSKGATQDNLSLDKLLSFYILIPPIATQRKIASILSAYDDLIENNTRRIAILEEMAQSLYREWFVHFRFPGHEKKRLLESELGLIPEGWEVVRFTDIADILSGGTPRTTTSEYWNGPIPFYTPRDAPSSFYVTETEKSITQIGLRACNSKLYPKNTVFITARGTVGKIVLSAVDMAMNQSCYALQGREGIDQFTIFFSIGNCIDQLNKCG
jgi:type I restriction enzyme, S subunit